MTPKELITRVQTLIKGLTWSVGNYVFGQNVFVVPEFPMQQLSQMVTPCCFIIETGQQSHLQHEGIIEQKFNVLILIQNVGDNMGGLALLGGNRVANTSSGAGVYDIELKIIEAMRDATSLSSAKVTLEGTSRMKLNSVKNNAPLVVRTLKFKSRVYLY